MTDVAKRVARIFLVWICVALPCHGVTCGPWIPDYVIGGKAIALDLDVFVLGADDRVDRSRTVGSRSQRYEALEREIRGLVAARVEAAGYEFETDPDHWQEADLGYYETSGQPHYRLNAALMIRPIYSADGGEVAFAFEINTALFAQFADPDETWIERFSDHKLDGAVASEVSARVLEHVSKILQALFAPGYDHMPRKETRTLLDGRFSIELLGPGSENLKEYFLGSYGKGTRIDLYREPKSSHRFPIASLVVQGWPNVMIDDEAHYLVTESSRASSVGARVAYEIRRNDGSVIRQFSTDDLLTPTDRWRLPRRPEARVDSGRRALVVEIPTCFPEGFAGHDYACAKDDHFDLAVDLETGLPLQPLRDLLPRLAGQFEISALDAEHALGPSYSTQCRANRSYQDFEDAALVRVDDSGIPKLALPDYTTIAEKVRIAGRVELALLVEPSGEVACVNVIKGLPMGLSEASVKTAFNWRFEPDPGSDQLRQIRVVLAGRMVVRQPPL